MTKTINLENMVEQNMPVLKIEVIDDESGKSTVGYLSPFRYYRFQVSGTKEGELDLGSSPVIGLKHILDIELKGGRGYEANNDPQKEFLSALAMVALNNWAVSRYGKNIDCLTIYKIVRDDKFYTFINECLNAIKRI